MAAVTAGKQPDPTITKHVRAFAEAAPQILPPLFACLRSSDEQLATESTWTLAAWANHGDATLISLVNAGLVPALLSRLYLLQRSPAAQGPACVRDATSGLERDPLAPALIPIIRILGNMAHADDQIIQTLLTYSFPAQTHHANNTITAAAPSSLPSTAVAAAPSPAPPSAFHLVFSTLERSLSSLHRGLKKEVCWVLSNLAATNLPQVHEALIMAPTHTATTSTAAPNPPHPSPSPSVFLRLLLPLLISANFDIQREVAHAVYNLCRAGDGRLMHIVLPRMSAAADDVATTMTRAYCSLLRSHDPDATLICLRFLDLLLTRHPDGVQIVEHRVDGIDALESVQQHMDQAELVSYAQTIVDRHFGVQQEEEGELEDTADTKQEESYPAWRTQHQTPPRNNNAGGSGGFQFQ